MKSTITEEEKKTLKAIGTRIMQRRKELGMTQGELADKIGMSWDGSVCRIEKGLVTIPVTTLNNIASALKVDMGSLVSDKEESKAARKVMAQMDQQTIEEMSYEDAFKTLLEAERLIGKLRIRLRKKEM